MTQCNSHNNTLKVTRHAENKISVHIVYVRRRNSHTQTKYSYIDLVNNFILYTMPKILRFFNIYTYLKCVQAVTNNRFRKPSHVVFSFYFFIFRIYIRNHSPPFKKYSPPHSTSLDAPGRSKRESESEFKMGGSKEFHIEYGMWKFDIFSSILAQNIKFQLCMTDFDIVNASGCYYSLNIINNISMGKRLAWTFFHIFYSNALCEYNIFLVNDWHEVSKKMSSWFNKSRHSSYLLFCFSVICH
jgi:hypothetical protein